jgi:hypothetical protein
LISSSEIIFGCVLHDFVLVDSYSALLVSVFLFYSS